jgi:hypothetical protein
VEEEEEEACDLMLDSTWPIDSGVVVGLVVAVVVSELNPAERVTGTHHFDLQKFKKEPTGNSV